MITVNKKQKVSFRQYKKTKQRELTTTHVLTGNGFKTIDCITTDKLDAYDMLVQRKFISTVELALRNTSIDVFEQTSILTYIHNLLNT